MPTRDHIEFEERSIAKGYLITFRCYGTWLHGDHRGSVDRRYFNRYGTPGITPNTEARSRKEGQLKKEPFILNAAGRAAIRSAIADVCSFRGYTLFASNVRTNHIHVVTGNHGSPERMMNGFKAYGTRALRSAGLIDVGTQPWSRHGSTRYLWTEEHLALAVDYVVNGQGGELPEFV